jgi:signal transduction histidine kinase
MRREAEPPTRELSLTERVLFERMGWFVEVRWMAGALAIIFMALGWYAFNVRFKAVPAVAVIFALFFYNAFFSLCARALYQARRIHKYRLRALAHGQISCDVLAVAVLVHYIGGVENHFIILFVFPMVVASEFFHERIAYGYATLGAVLVNLIGWGEYFLPSIHYPLMVLASKEPLRYEPLVAPGAAQHWVYVLQVCFVMTFAVYITVFVASSIASRLRSREEELQVAYTDLRSLEQVKSAFMRKTSHELRAPIGALQSLLKAALLKMPEDAAGRDLVSRGVDRTESMLDLIDDLLRYSRLRAAVIVERFEPVELAEIVRRAGDLLRPRAEEKQIALDVRAEPAMVLGVRDSLADLVTNLLSNAIRYTPPGGRVSLRCLADGGARIEVADSGVGIPPDELPHIFEEFFRGREARKMYAHGTGLGMAIVSRVVEMHNGRIEVHSDVGKGTQFTVTFPPAFGPPGARPAYAIGPR